MIDMTQCPSCQSTNATHSIGGKYVFWYCLHCLKSWMTPIEAEVKTIRKGMTETGTEWFEAKDAK